jgi:signal transduction histidine kinase/ATP-dependent protease HslVU (ClpYQ) peptidase subunit
VIEKNNIFYRVVNFGIKDDVKEIDKRLLRFISAFLIAAIVAVGGVLLAGFISQKAGFNYVAAIIGVVVFTTLWLILYKTQNVSLGTQLTLLAINILCVYILIDDKLGTAPLWLFAFPMVAGLMLKWKKAVLWLLIYFISIAAVSISPAINPEHARDPIFAITFGASLAGMAGFTIGYRRIAEVSEKRLQETEEQLRIANEKMTADLEFAERSRKALDGLSSSLSKQNNKLAKSKKALLNLLEDARELEDQLKSAKERVEEKVVERTKELSTQRARLESTLHSLPLSVMLIDEQGRVIDANRMAIELGLGAKYKPGISKLDRAVQNSLTSLAVTKFGLSKNIQACLKGAKHTTASEISYKDRYYRAVVGPVRGNGEEQKGAVVAIEDVTEQKMLDRAKDEFLMIASHELRTPLTAIRGDASVLNKMISTKPKPAELQPVLDDIEESSTRLLGIVNDYLEISSLEQGRLVIKLDKVDIAEQIKTVVHENQSIANDKKLKLVFKSPKSNPTGYLAKADKNRSRQVIENLVANAIHYTGKGSITVELSRSDKSINCRVKDTGVGISKASQSRLFHKFSQAQENLLTRDPSRSTGLGLYITKLMVEKMGGNIVLESSNPGKGSVFSFSLPAHPTRGRANKITVKTTKKS